MKIELLEVGGFYPAIRAMRLPMKSGDKSDSVWIESQYDHNCSGCPYVIRHSEYTVCRLKECRTSLFVIGQKDHELSMRLIKAGSDHRKHIRLIEVWAMVRASRAFWSEADTYRYGVDKVSESTMHRILKDNIDPMDDFDDYTTIEAAESFIRMVDQIKVEIEDEKLKLNLVKAIIPEGYLQRRICKFSYEALRHIYHARKNHRLYQWIRFCEWIESLPYAEFITTPEGKGEKE